MLKGQTLLCGIIIVIVICLVWSLSRARAYRDVFNGYWEAPDRFCQQAGIICAQVFFHGDSMYIYMSDSAGPIINRVVPIEFTTRITGGGQEWTVCTDAHPLPERFTARYDPEGGMLGFYDADTLYLKLYKNCSAMDCQ